MDAREAIKLGLESGQMIGFAYLDDMSDEELMHRPHEGCNHIKWQVGHLIASENQIINGVVPGSMPALPEGFAEKYSRETAKSDDASAFDTKEALLQVYNEQRAAALATLDQLTDDDLDTEGPEEMKAYAPTVGAAFNLLGGHWLMHAANGLSSAANLDDHRCSNLLEQYPNRSNTRVTNWWPCFCGIHALRINFRC